MKSLREQLEAAIMRGIDEGMKRSRRDVFSVSAERIEDESEFSASQCWQTYYSVDDAISAARELKDEVQDYEELIIIYVYSGEYQTPTGDILGEPEAFWCCSNKDQETTVAALKEAGWCSPECDEYS